MYHYLHSNGKIIDKPDVAVDRIGAMDYFKSAYVKHYWYVSKIDAVDKKYMVNMVKLLIEFSIKKNELQKYVNQYPILKEVNLDGCKK